MDLSTFPYFLSLPFEIRREIYWLATPPRIVNVEEKTVIDFDEFREILSTHPIQLHIHPGIGFFSINWAAEIQQRIRDGRSLRQTTLEEHGFTGSKPIPQPWTPSAQCPEIPLAWLANDPKVAWELMREGYLYSKAPIPPLLHTCAESRGVLMRGGYRLAFATRTAEARTWFHFDRDTLFLSQVAYEDEERLELLSGGLWDVGQFTAADLQRVRRLALEGSASVLYDMDMAAPWQVVPATASVVVSLLLRLLGSVEELLFVEWTRREVENWSMFERCFPSPAVEESAVDVARRSSDFVGVDVELVDVGGQSGWCDGAFGSGFLRSGFGALNFVKFMEDRQESGAGGGAESGAASYHGYLGRLRQVYLEHQMAAMLAKEKDRVEMRMTDDGPNVGCWKIPETKLVHVLPRNMIQYLYEERRRVAAGLKALQKEWAHMKKQQLHHLAVCGEALRVDSALSERQEFEHKHWPSNDGRHEDCQGTCYSIHMENNLKKWWVQHGPSL
ncbi:hypothetical protein CFIO01_06821 [Colletotrichum fioriniae PJ7]|uniref:2EXR domain-containing protein n=1 Tax=Colletotrichum fioriniae PJ7 TaxID=1445577 RepID=A0A010Q311_9PEZI|nr:hypothetical protein CFIO01_06821 [Colletotrichum fioriniae PJ7]